MNKITYIKPSFEVMHTRVSNILCASPTGLQVNNDKIDEWNGNEEEKPEGWGEQW